MKTKARILFGLALLAQQSTLALKMQSASSATEGAPACNDGDVRISPSSTLNAGVSMYPQVCRDGKYFDICGHYFWGNDNGATTFCKKLGFNSGIRDLPNSRKRHDGETAEAVWVGECDVGEELNQCTLGHRTDDSFYTTEPTCTQDYYKTRKPNYHPSIPVICDGGSSWKRDSAPAPAPPPNAGGDPHLLNIKGERFNIHRMGYAPLVSIVSDGAAHLEVMALIDGMKKCSKKMYITDVNSSGSWLEKSIAVSVARAQETRAFSVMVDGQEVWSPQTPVNKGYEPPTTEKTIFNHADKFVINEVTGESQPGIEVKTAHNVKMKIVRPLYRANVPPHLNFDIQGLEQLSPSFKLGGLLGRDDHSYWSARDQDCGGSFAEEPQNLEALIEGSIASAH